MDVCKDFSITRISSTIYRRTKERITLLMSISTVLESFSSEVHILHH